MDSFEIDNVKAEKEDALRRYNMERKLRLGLRYMGFLLVLFLISWSWFPPLTSHIIEVAGDLSQRYINTLNDPFFIFILMNIIILVVYILSTQKQSTSSGIYDEYVSSHRSIIPAEAAVLDKQIVVVENAVDVAQTKRPLSPIKQQPWMTKTKPAITSTDKVKQKEYRRTRSVLSESGKRRPRRVYRRSETAITGRELVVCSAESAREAIHEMSNEEFQLKVDSFIAERRKALMQENIAHYTKCMSIVVKN
ncbi:hypothetical protein CXB51_000890 [Gossypium anomalum]|uniref:DUF4408 domain-containing protein n=1 Tax=Gossypium anomalum TaxID=47600 RepID=A0A8J6DD37_9ROSI|nr:hypothetical protein CXB51_000890 [Gossypium anomalum]